MRDIVAICGGIGILIGIYLVLNKGTQSVNIINAFAGNAIKGISTLQGNKVS
ncbi:hypothetical protein [Paenibacillus sp. MER 99-2]|uniref:hypothetical protein n=1 Tax=Paenibacillus sp. MER 99-2 TaxID=2939572 RepID=UPI0020422938|nr:hypothetical protein [Paenibacillus sp. MER 99-2]MCM3176229.1 hypothetical protein [Paenibacillus sp. MER 99-2]